jgi:hypothetical protein
MAIKSKKYLIFFSVLCLGTLAGIAQADSAGTVILAIKSVTTDGKAFDGMWVEIRSGSNLVHSGFTPLSYNATQGTAYTISVSDYRNYGFLNWNDGSMDYSKSITPMSDTTLVARYIGKATSASNMISEQSPQIPKNSTSEPPLLPDWLRDVASSWLSGQLSDKDFITNLQRLIDQKILLSPEKETSKQEGFSNTQCKKGEMHVEMVGKYTNGDKPYEIVSLRMTVLDSKGEILASGSGTISNIGVHESKYFNIVARHSTEFASCEIQVESVLPKLASRN